MDDAKQSYGKIYGQEKNLSTSAIARMNLFLHGAKEFKIRREDTLRKGVLWLTEEAITKGGASLLPKDSIIVVIRSAALRHEFHVAVTEVPVVINQDLKAFQPKPEFMPIYLQWAIMSHESSLLGKVQTVLTSHIEMSDLLSIPVMVADLEQQQAFCDFKQQADKSKFAAQQALADLTATQKALMRQYLG